MKRLAFVSGLLGLLLLTGLVAKQGAADVAHIVLQAGWALLWLVPLHLLALLLDAQGWRVLLARSDPAGHAGPGFLLWVATVREAVNRLLPTIGVGGELVGIRLARRRVPDATGVTASVVIEVMLTLFANYLFAAAGVMLLLATTQAGAHGVLIVTGLLLSLPVPALFAISLRHASLFVRLEALAQRLLGEDHHIAALIDGARLDAQIRQLTRRYWAMLRALGWQVAGLLVGTLEVWWGLALLGHPVTIGQAFAIEALTMAARQMAFFIPAGLGVQEAVMLLLGSLMGVDPQTSLSLALVKRAREILTGVPALLSWQWLEWWSRRPVRQVPEALPDSRTP
ncbi:lysylphosphatidylglycerol synthase domain-containing protein [Cupriavidus campinensis]